MRTLLYIITQFLHININLFFSFGSALPALISNNSNLYIMQNKQITLPEFLNSKTFVNAQGLVYPSPAEIINLFPDTSHINNIEVALNNVNANDNGELNISYSRAKIIVNPTNLNPIFCQSIGIVYAMDLKNPTIKIFSGINVNACLNQAVFRAKNLVKLNMLHELNAAPEHLINFINNANADFEFHNNIYESLDSTILNVSNLKDFIGHIIVESKRNKLIGANRYIDFAINELLDINSKYFFNNNPSFWNIYNALTQHNTESGNILDENNRSFEQYELLNSYICRNSNPQKLLL